MEQVPRVVRGIPGSSGFSCIHRTGGLKRPRILCSLTPSPPRNAGLRLRRRSCGEGGSCSPEPLGDAEWGRWPLFQPFCPLPGSKRSQAPPSGAEAPGGDLGKGTVAKVGSATVPARGLRPGSPSSSGLRGRRLYTRSGRVPRAGYPGAHVASHPSPEWRVTSPLAGVGGV